MPLDDFELTLTAMANGGKALGRHGRRMIFVPYALPGEKITARIVDDRGRFAFAEIATFLEPSPERVVPQCPHFGPGRCGGCHWQHIYYPAQLHYKREIVQDQLKRVGDIEDAVVHDVLADQNPWQYLSRATFYLEETGDWAFMSADPPHLMPIEECHIVRDEILDLLTTLEMDYGDLERLTVQIGSDGVGMLIISTNDDLAPGLHVDFPLSVNLLLSDNEPVNLIGSSNVVYEVLGRPLRVTAGSFFRPNVPMVGVLTEQVLARLDLQGHESVLDLYAGVGNFSAFIAERAALVTLVESYPPAVTDADENLAEFEHVDVFEGGVAPVLASLLEEGAGPYDAAVVDPLPQGLDIEVIDLLSEFAPPTLVYVSSDPATLARDAKRLAGHGYHLLEVQPLDMAPQTYHIECVARFVRK